MLINCMPPKNNITVIKGLILGEKRSYKKKKHYQKQKAQILMDTDYETINEGPFYILLKKKLAIYK